MAKQLERGRQYPLRPSRAIFTIASNFTPPADAPPVDWTVAGTKMTLLLGQKFMDDSARITISGGNVVLKKGIYVCKMTPILFNQNVTGSVTARLALTNAAGSTVHVESPSFTLGARVATSQMTDFAAAFEFVLRMQSDDQIAMRAACSTGTDTRVLAGQVLVVERIGNHDEP